VGQGGFNHFSVQIRTLRSNSLVLKSVRATHSYKFESEGTRLRISALKGVSIAILSKVIDREGLEPNVMKNCLSKHRYHLTSRRVAIGTTIGVLVVIIAVIVTTLTGKIPRSTAVNRADSGPAPGPRANNIGKPSRPGGQID
jgi:hypothetical protein